MRLSQKYSEITDHMVKMRCRVLLEGVVSVERMAGLRCKRGRKITVCNKDVLSCAEAVGAFWNWCGSKTASFLFFCFFFFKF